MPNCEGFDAWRSRAGTGGFGFADESHRSKRTQLRRAPKHPAHPRADRRRHAGRGQRGGRPVTEPPVRRRGARPEVEEVVAAAAADPRELMASARLSRRGLLIGAAALVGAASCSHKPAPQNGPNSAGPLPPFADRIAALEQVNDAYIGLFAVDLETETSLVNRADDPFAMCSTFKAYAASRVLQKSAVGELGLSDPIRIEQADIVANSPVTQPRVGSTMTVAELC